MIYGACKVAAGVVTIVKGAPLAITVGAWPEQYLPYRWEALQLSLATPELERL